MKEICLSNTRLRTLLSLNWEPYDSFSHLINHYATFPIFHSKFKLHLHHYRQSLFHKHQSHDFSRNEKLQVCGYPSLELHRCWWSDTIPSMIACWKMLDGKLSKNSYGILNNLDYLEADSKVRQFSLDQLSFR